MDREVSDQINASPTRTPKVSLVSSSTGGGLPAIIEVTMTATPSPVNVPMRMSGKAIQLCSKISLRDVAPTFMRSKFSDFLSEDCRTVSAMMLTVPDIKNSPEIPISAFRSNEMRMGGC